MQDDASPSIEPVLWATLERLWERQSEAERRRVRRRRVEAIAQVVIGILAIVVPVALAWALWPDLTKPRAWSGLSVGEIIEIRRAGR
jgi:hypothetical protein